MKEEKKFFFNNLVLLIGTNPLPNLVVADYFLKENPKLKKIWLIHSKETDKQADQLEKVLNERWNSSRQNLFPLQKISLSDVSSASSIRNDINQKMLDELKDGKRIHLNYTGGTKSMSTHVYWILKELKEAETEFSYLDARTFRLISDEKGIIESDMRKKVSLTFDEMIRLHGFERKNKPKDFLFLDALKVFQDLIENEKLGEFYTTGGHDRTMFLDDKGNISETIKKISESSKNRLKEFKPNATLMSVINQMPGEYRLFNEAGQFNEKIANKKFEAAVKFLDGEWMEVYLANILRENLIQDNIEIEQNWEIKKPDWPSDLYFELDVVLLNGYQLTGMSCTTDKSKSLCKSKGFEIIHRTRQIGGDESKAVLATRMDKDTRDKVQQELMYETGESRGNILVLGENDLKKDIFLEKIKQFIFNDEEGV